MRNHAFASGSRVQVTSYGPFRGLKGTILQINTLTDDWDEMSCLYFIALYGTICAEPIWFDSNEIELIGVRLPPFAPPNQRAEQWTGL